MIRTPGMISGALLVNAGAILYAGYLASEHGSDERTFAFWMGMLLGGTGLMMTAAYALLRPVSKPSQADRREVEFRP